MISISKYSLWFMILQVSMFQRFTPGKALGVRKLKFLIDSLFSLFLYKAGTKNEFAVSLFVRFFSKGEDKSKSRNFSKEKNPQISIK